jgi:nucleoside-diphosphate-sugar epimerase
MKILVTGATGFVGSHLTDRLSSDGHDVFSLIRSEKKAQEFNVKGTLIKGSLSPDSELSWIDELPTDLDVVIHTAGIVHAEDVSVFTNINYLSTVNLVEKLQKKFDKLHFTFISSLAAGGPSSFSAPRTEEMKDMPVSAYGRSKKVAEDFFTNGLPKGWTYNCIRPPMVIGPRDPAVLDIFKMVKSGLVVGPGLDFKSKEYSFVCVHDLVDAIILLSTKQNGGTFYVGHDEILTFESLIQTIQKELNKKFILNIPIPNQLLKFVAAITAILPIPNRLTKDKVNELIQVSWSCSNQEIKEKLGFQPNWNIEKTVKETTRDYLDRNWL